MSGDIAIETPGVGSEPVAAPGDPAAAETPTIRIERGNPSPEQLAALTLVLSALGGDASGAAHERRARTLWTARSRFARPRPAVGPGGWRASALPR